jgi:hypothetical protein
VRVAYAHGRTEATLELRHPKLRFFYRPPPVDAAKDDRAAKADEAARHAEPPRAEVASDPATAVPDALRRMAPIDIDRIEIHDGEVVFVDMSKPAKPEIWLSDLEVSIENVASRPGMADGRPLLLAARAKVQRSGDLVLFVTADPWSEELNFSGRVSLEGLATKELYGFLADTAKLQMPKGSLDMYIAFTAKDGHITGGVKPILKNVEVAPVASGPIARLKAWAVDKVLGLFSDRVRGRNAVATVIPIRGELGGPKVTLWPAITGVLYNAYVSGVAGGFGGVPAAGSKGAGAQPSAAESASPATADEVAPQSGGGGLRQASLGVAR